MLAQEKDIINIKNTIYKDTGRIDFFTYWTPSINNSYY